MSKAGHPGFWLSDYWALHLFENRHFLMHHLLENRHFLMHHLHTIGSQYPGFWPNSKNNNLFIFKKNKISKKF